MKQNYTIPEITIVELELQDCVLSISSTGSSNIESLEDNGSYGAW